MMKLIRQTLVLLAAFMIGCSTDNEMNAETINTGTSENTTMTQTIYLSVDGQKRSVTLADNAATHALIEALQQDPINYVADDYGGFEKVGPLGRSLPTSNEQITTQPGDIMLYNGNQIVIFYGTNSWSYTRLGKIEGISLEELKSFLKAGGGKVNVTLSVDDAGIRPVGTSLPGDGESYFINGIKSSDSSKGIRIRNGKKYVR